MSWVGGAQEKPLRWRVVRATLPQSPTSHTADEHSHQSKLACIALHFFANSSFLYNIGDAEHLGKATVCRAVRKVTLVLKRPLSVMVVFPGHKSVRNKKEFHWIAGGD